jgi:hypothetical protein
MDNTGREGEETLFDIIRSPSPDGNEEDDGSQYLNPTGGGMIFDEDERIEEVQNNDDEGNVVLQITKTGEVYLYKASGDHHMF